MTITLRLPQPLHDELFAMATNPVETGAVLLARLVRIDSDRSVLIGTELIPVPEEAYEVRTSQSLQVTSDGYVHALKRARSTGTVPIWVHSHPGNGSVPRPSRHDHLVNSQLTELFADRSESVHYGFLIVSHNARALTFTGGVEGAVTGPISQLSVIGAQWIFRAGHDSERHVSYDLFDRNIRAFGHQIQDTISGITVAIVGAGGTGSSTAEQLARLGVRWFILIDPKDLSESNLTRVYGSTPSDVGLPKVDVLGDHLERITPGVNVTRIRGSVTTQAVAEALRGADVVFGCTDDNAGRLRLSRLPYYYLTPVIDCGVQIDSDANDIISGIFGRVTVVHPGTACLVCRDRIDFARAEAEVRSAEEQTRLEQEGYAPALPGVEPAVVTFTTLVAATAVSELIERLVGYGETPTPSEQILYVHDRTSRVNTEEPHVHHYCDPTVPRVDTDDDMFLGLNWAS